MIAILTKYLGPTDKRGARVKAYTCNGHSVTIPFDDSLADVRAHLKAAQKLAREQFNYLLLCETMCYGGTAEGYAFTFTISTVDMGTPKD